MSDQVSNKSSISSHHSSISQDHEIPILIAVEERLPTFAKAATTNLPHVIIPNDKEPPSFHLVEATHKAEQEFPPISPQTTEILLRTHPDINKAIHAIAYGLIATIHCRTLHASQELDTAHIREHQLRQQITANNFETTHLREQLGMVNIPPGFEPKMGNVSNTVPLSTREC